MTDSNKRPNGGAPRRSPNDAGELASEEHVIPPRTDEIQEREEHVGRADWNASHRAGEKQPDDSSPETRTRTRDESEQDI